MHIHECVHIYSIARQIRLSNEILHFSILIIKPFLSISDATVEMFIPTFFFGLCENKIYSMESFDAESFGARNIDTCQ